jgi:CRISPR-associated protein Csy3
MAKATLQIPSMLSFRKSLIPSRGLLYACAKDCRRPAEIAETTVRGTISNFADGYKKGDGQIKRSDLQNPNIQTIDACFLPDDADALQIEFTLAVLPNALRPDACNDGAYRAMLEKFADLYAEKDGFATLGGLYAWNLANARYLWRNRYGLDKTVKIFVDGGEAPAFDFKADAIGLEKADAETFVATESGRKLGALIADALAGKTPPLSLRVLASVKLGAGQEVWPSQEFIQSEGRGKQPGDKGKTLASIPLSGGGRHAILHAQKIGNALRTIDIWHKHLADYGPLAAEPYGVVQKYAEIAREVGKNDLFAYLQNLDRLVENLETQGPSPECHFVVACLTRGGVFSGEGKEEQKKKKEAKAAETD